MKIGSYNLYSIETSEFRLDGGAMFGIIPKTMWRKFSPADGLNRIHLVTRSLLLVNNKRKILIDTGNGTKWEEKYKRIYQIDTSIYNIETSLNKFGYTSEDITDVICTHLHFDHVGGNTKFDEGKIVLMDRYYYSTMAYQAAAGIDVSRIRKDNEFAPKPDIVLIFDLPADLAMKRVRSHSVADVFEKEEHLEKVRKAYLNLEDDSLVRIIDATRTPEVIFDEVWRLVSEVRNG